MNNYKLVQHNVKSASFVENREKEKKKDIEVSVEGGILIPKDLRKTKYLIVQLKLNLGKSEERLYLTLETISRFEVEKDSDSNEISEEEVRLKCFPVALSELRKTVKKVTEAYGIPVVNLPPFEEETESE
jgi:hypothetical protein